MLKLGDVNKHWTPNRFQASSGEKKKKNRVARAQGSDKLPSHDVALLAWAVYSCTGSVLILLSVSLVTLLSPASRYEGDRKRLSVWESSAVDPTAPQTMPPQPAAALQALLGVSQGKPCFTQGDPFAWADRHTELHRRQLHKSSPRTRWFGRSCMCLRCREVWEWGAILGPVPNQRLPQPGRASAAGSTAFLLLLRSLQTCWYLGGGLGARVTISQGCWRYRSLFPLFIWGITLFSWVGVERRGVGGGLIPKTRGNLRKG